MNRILKVPPLAVNKAQDEAELIKTVDVWFTKLHEQGKFNGVVLIRKNGISKLSNGYGFADHNKKRELTPSSSLRIASLSKQFTAAGIMILCDQQKLTYDDCIQQYLPAMPYDGVTIRHLLNQTSGIPDIYLAFATKKKTNPKILSTAAVIQLLIEENRKPTAPPNQVFQYSNTNYVILARIIEIIARQPFEDFMKSQVFAPMNMTNTRVYNALSEKADGDGLVEDLEFNGSGFTKVEPDFLDGVAGDGGIFTSLNDLEVWDDFWHGKLLLDQKKISEAFKEVRLADGTVSRYGFGWMITDDGMWHNGSWLGARSMLIRNTAQASCIAIIDNSSNIYFDKILNEMEKVGRVN